MKRFIWIFGLLACVIGASALAATAHYEEGTHYVDLVIPIKTRSPDKVEVTEYFSYGCPHCFQFDAQISAWENQLPDDVVFNRTPAVWNPDYQVYAQTYYAAEALDVLDKVHTPLFNAIHVERRKLNDPALMAKFFGQYGVDPVDFAKTYTSFGVRASLQQADARGRAYRSTGVPAMIVNGKYRVEGAMAGSNADMLRVVDFLIAKERAAMANSTAAASQ